MKDTHLVGETLLKTLGRLLLDRSGDLGVASGVRNTLSVLVLHVDGLLVESWVEEKGVVRWIA